MDLNDPFDQVALLQLAILQQDMFEREEEEVRRRRRRRRPRRWWVRPWLSAEKRLTHGHYDRLMAELRVDDTQSFVNFVRVEPQMFDELLRRVGARIVKKDTKLRRALSPGLKLAITIRYTMF